MVGSGGAGCNTLNRIFEVGIEGVSTVAMNTDAHHLVKTKADKKLLLGKNTTKGLGAGSNPTVGEEAAKESKEEIGKLLANSQMVFVTCGLGGGTGTGSAHIIAEEAKNLGALTISVVTLPFISEGRVRRQNALEGLNKLKRQVDTVIVIPNDKLLAIVPDLPLNTAFKVADEVLSSSVKGITELITKVGLVNLDFADLRTILKDAGCAVIGFGESNANVKPDERAITAVENALSSPLLDTDISEANKALVNVTGGADMTLREAELVVEELSKRIHPNSHIIWGARVEPDLSKAVMKVLVVIAGAKLPNYEKVEVKPEPPDIDLDSII